MDIKIFDTGDLFNELKRRGYLLEDYRKAFYILMEYWDSLPDIEKKDINKRLKECGL